MHSSNIVMMEIKGKTRYTKREKEYFGWKNAPSEKEFSYWYADRCIGDDALFFEPRDKFELLLVRYADHPDVTKELCELAPKIFTDITKFTVKEGDLPERSMPLHIARGIDKFLKNHNLSFEDWIMNPRYVALLEVKSGLWQLEKAGILNTDNIVHLEDADDAYNTI